jgi:methionine synthase I (cobalamin-dependent)
MINRRAFEIARRAAGPGRFVIGSIGPTASDHGRAQAEILAESGVDALVFETHRLDQAAVALQCVRPAIDRPLIVSLSIRPEDVDLSVCVLEDLGASVIGGNCQTGTFAALALIERLRPLTRLPLWVKPSAGLPGGPLDEPASFAAMVPDCLRLDVRFLGGCCGTTEAHVAALRAACYASR